jgi:glutathione S-transferase
MPFEYVSTADAVDRKGLRMIVVGAVPSPWGEAAKGIVHMKRIPWVAVRLAYDDAQLAEWAGQRSGPVAFYDSDKPRSGWAEILLLLERLAPDPRLIPAEPAERALLFGLSHELLGEAGMAWTRRLQLIDAGLQGRGGFAPPIAKYLSKKYGYTPQLAAAAPARVAELAGLFVARLKAQRARGQRYYFGDAPSALDIYSATCAAMFRPLPQDVCAMDASTRAAFETRDELTDAALDPVWFEHRDMMYAEHLELPLSL